MPQQVRAMQTVSLAPVGECNFNGVTSQMEKTCEHERSGLPTAQVRKYSAKYYSHGFAG
jgi:hypothetical protein